MSGSSDEAQFDTTRPFIAIVPYEIPGDFFDPTEGVYLVNPLDVALTNTYERIGGFFSTEDTVLEASPRTKGPWDIEPRSALLLEMSSIDEFYELVCWWTIEYEIAGQKHSIQFHAGKALRQTRAIENCPVLNRKALLVSSSGDTS